MAEKAAHLTATLQTSPSVFEVIAQESLAQTVHPAFKRVAQFLATSDPNKLGWLVRWYEELFLTLNTILQWHYIKNQGASFSEAFYGLRRYTNTNQALNLPLRQQIISICTLVLLPYILAKIEQHEKDLSDSNNLQKKVYKAHRISRAMWQGVSIVQLVAYMSGSSKYHSPLSRMCRLALCYAPVLQQDDWTWTDFIAGKISLQSILGVSLVRSVEIGAFFIQFLRWWQADKLKIDITALPRPPQPSTDPKAGRYKGRCPICLQQWRVPVALPVSGYVYCHRCIQIHLETSKTCPITGYPASPDDIIRIYDTNVDKL